MGASFRLEISPGVRSSSSELSFVLSILVVSSGGAITVDMKWRLW